MSHFSDQNIAIFQMLLLLRSSFRHYLILLQIDQGEKFPTTALILVTHIKAWTADLE